MFDYEEGYLVIEQSRQVATVQGHVDANDRAVYKENKADGNQDW
jgi:hypothetical protein